MTGPRGRELPGPSSFGASAPGPAAARQVGLYAATAITVGDIIGSGIFRSPHTVAHLLPGLELVVLAWTLGGLLSLCGSLSVAELAAAKPRTGGLYVFIRDGFGPRWAFVFGWAALWVVRPTGISSVAYVFSVYFCDALGLAANLRLPIGIASIVFLTAVNWSGVRQGAGTQSLFTTLKMIGIAGLCVAAFVVHPPAGGGAAGLAAAPASAAPASAHPLLLAFALAMIPILFAYDGWVDPTFVAGEVQNPRRTLPIAIIAGTFIVIATYLLANLAYYHALGPDGVARHEAVGAEVMRLAAGPWGGRALAVLVAVSTFGTINGGILTGARITEAMAADGLLLSRAARLDPVRGTPAFALGLQCVLAVVWLAAATGFEDVAGWMVTTSWLFYGLAIATLFVQRRRERAGAAEPSPYRAPLYPLPPLLFVLVTGALIASDLATSGWRAIAGVLVAATGVPVYWLVRGRLNHSRTVA